MNSCSLLPIAALLVLVTDPAFHERSKAPSRPIHGIAETLDRIEGECVSFAGSVLGDNGNPGERFRAILSQC
jgi:hypothetical protein